MPPENENEDGVTAGTQSGNPTNTPPNNNQRHNDSAPPARRSINLGDTPTTVGQDIGNFFKVLLSFFVGLWNRDFADFEILSAVYFPDMDEEMTPEQRDFRNRIDRMNAMRDEVLADPNRRFSAAELASLTEGLDDRQLRSLPRKMMLDLIASAESPGYNVAQGGRHVNFTSMTVGEVMQWQRDNRGVSESTAVGRYQIVSGTLRGLVQKYNIDVNAKFDEAMQDRLANHLLDQRGFNEYMAGRKSLSSFMLSLSQEWAGLPKDGGGMSFHHGVGSNRATITSDKVQDTLLQVKAVGEELTTKGLTIAAAAEPTPAFRIPRLGG